MERQRYRRRLDVVGVFSFPLEGNARASRARAAVRGWARYSERGDREEPQ